MKINFGLVLYKLPHLFLPSLKAQGTNQKQICPVQDNLESKIALSMKFKEWKDPIKTHKPWRHVGSIAFLGRYLWGDMCRRDEVAVGTWHHIYVGTPSARKTAFCLFGLDAEHGLLLCYGITAATRTFKHDDLTRWKKKAMGILLLLLSLTVGNADSVNTFLDGTAGEANPFLFWKSHYPISAAAAHLPLQFLKADSELESLFSAVWGGCFPYLPWFPFGSSKIGKKSMAKIFFSYLGPEEFSQGSEKS